MGAMPTLRLGPVLRFVSSTEATIWVETDVPCEVDILHASARTVTVAGHHYALVPVVDLAPGSDTPYEVRLDGEVVWPPAEWPYPASRIRTPAESRKLRAVFGSCRHATPMAFGKENEYDPDALDTYAQRPTSITPGPQWPDVLMLLGDQVYADETSPDTKAYIATRRDINEPPYGEVADFEEYTRLYLESWGDPDVRWLLSTVPSMMIFDDHDVRDDWNTSESWRLDMAATNWWHDRIIGGLSSYFLYQHLGNLSPAQLAAEPTWVAAQKISADGGDAWELLRSFAERADSEADGGKSYQWSYRRDFGRTRVLVIDSRCGRVLANGHRSMVSAAEWAWIKEQARGDYDHLLIGSSLPWLLPRAIHDVEATDEALCAGVWGQRWAVAGESMRRYADMEHWAAMRESFEAFADLVRSVGRGDYGPAPATVCVLSGDVHHAYVAEASLSVDSRVYQLTCSPVHNNVPIAMRLGFTAGWSRWGARLTRLFTLGARVPAPAFGWHKLAGPYFGNMLATLDIDRRAARLTLERSRPGTPASLRPAAAVPLSWHSRLPSSRRR